MTGPEHGTHPSPTFSEGTTGGLGFSSFQAKIGSSPHSMLEKVLAQLLLRNRCPEVVSGVLTFFRSQKRYHPDTTRLGLPYLAPPLA